MLVLCTSLFLTLLVGFTLTGFIIPWLFIGFVVAVIDLYAEKNEDHSIFDHRFERFICVTLLGVFSVFTARENIGVTIFGKDLYFNVVDFKFGKRKKWSELS